MCMKVFVALCGEMMQWFCIDVCHIVIFFSCHLRPCLSVFDGLFKCFLCQGSNVQSSKPNRSFSKNCPEFTGNPSKIKFFWSFLLMSACDCKSWKFNFCNQFRVQQNIFERSFWIVFRRFCQFVGFASHLLVSCQSRSHKAGVVNFVVKSLSARETSSKIKRVELILQRNRQLVESIWQQNQQHVLSKRWTWITTPDK
jgi:hypothetical protein